MSFVTRRPSPHYASAKSRSAQGRVGAEERRQPTNKVEGSRMGVIAGVSDRLCSVCLDVGVLEHLWIMAMGLSRVLICPTCDRGEYDAG